MKIPHWPVAERPREKLLAQHVKNLSQAELLAIILQCGTAKKTALDLARELLNHFGGLKKLQHTKAQALLQVTGIGKAKCAMLQAAFELGRRCYEEEILFGDKLNNSSLGQQFFSTRLEGRSHEVFACLFLNVHNRVIAFEELFQGTLTETSVYPREVVKRGLAHNAARIILGHNHPSGDPTPSPADQELTQILKKTLALVDIQVIDHIIVGEKRNFSFAEAGLM